MGPRWDEPGGPCEEVFAYRLLAPLFDRMAKSKNHTAHNQSAKAHKNGIKKPKRERYSSMKG